MRITTEFPQLRATLGSNIHTFETRLVGVAGVLLVGLLVIRVRRSLNQRRRKAMLGGTHDPDSAHDRVHGGGGPQTGPPYATGNRPLSPSFVSTSRRHIRKRRSPGRSEPAKRAPGRGP
jgi:hypothetical protein